MAKIALFNPSLDLKTFWLKRILYELEDHELLLVTNKRNDSFENLKPVTVNRFPWKILKKLKDLAGIPWLDKWLLQKLKLEQVDLILINFLSFARDYQYLIKHFNGKVLIHVHGKDVTWDYIKPETGQPLYSDRYFDFIDGLPEKVSFIANSFYSKRKLEERGIDGNKIHVKYFGVPRSDSGPAKAFPKDKALHLLFLGRLVDAKNPLLLIETFVYARMRGLNARLTIAGGGELLDKCKELARMSAYSREITFTGWVDHDRAMELYHDADLLVMPNRKGTVTRQEEAFGLSYLEAMSFGLPAIGGNSGGVPEIIDHRKNGFLLYSFTKEELSGHLFTLEQDRSLLKQMSDNALNTIYQKFSEKREKEEMNRIIKLYL